MDYKKYNDYELIYMVREKDDTSYGTLFHKYLPIIKRIASDYYKSYCDYGYDLDDFVQEGYLGFQNAILSYDEHKDVLFYTFVSLCIKRRILTFCKRITCDKKNIRNTELVDCDTVPIEDSTIHIEYDSLCREMVSEIWDVVYSFSLEYTCVFELRFNHFQYQEIESLLDIPVRRAEFMMRRMIQKIRKEKKIFV